MKKRCIQCKRWFENKEEYIKHICIQKELKTALKMGMTEKEGVLWSISSIAKKLKNGKK
jgi:hypothetical protein